MNDPARRLRTATDSDAPPDDPERDAIRLETPDGVPETPEPAPPDLQDCWADELGDPSEEPPRQAWLLHDAIGDMPAIPRGRAGMLAAAGGTSKTTACVMLAVAVVDGSEWLGFVSQTPGNVALVCAESDRLLLRRLIWRACNARHMPREQRAKVTSCIRVFPLAGRDIALLKRGEFGNLETTEGYHALRAKLEALATDGGFEWALVVLDPLSRVAGPDTETDNAAATRFVEVVESLCTLPGAPTVLVTHHSSKTSIRSGANDARGVTALRDGFRFVLTMTRVRKDDLVGVHLACDKNNEAPEFSSRFLVRQSREQLAEGWLDVGGTLRLATDDEAATLAAASGIATGDPDVRREERERAKDQAKIAKAQARRTALLGCLPFAPDHLTTSQVAERAEAQGLARAHEGFGAELRALCELGLARDLSPKGPARQWCRAPSEVAP